MKNFLALVGLLVVAFAGIGWYCEWYKIGTVPSSDGHRKFTVDVNQKEIVNDVTGFKEKVSEVINSESKDAPKMPSVVERKSDSQSPGVQFGPNGNPVIVLPKLEIRTGN